jgi:hypothetical protein
MRTNTKRIGVRRVKKTSLIRRLRQRIARHLKNHLIIYVPAAVPLAFFVIAHALTLVTVILIKSGVLPQSQILHKTVVTWAVYGVLPLLLCSYGCFFAVARPTTGILGQKFPEWPQERLTWTAGAVYGTAVVLALLILLTPGSPLRMFFLLVIGMVTGQGNWLLYRKLTVVPTQEQAPPAD